MLFRIACYNIFPISYVCTIPIDKCVFLYATSINGCIYFPSLFIQTIIKAHRSKSRKHRLFFPAFISRILAYLELEYFVAFDPIYLTTPLGSPFLRQRQAQKKTVEPSAGSSKRLRVESTAGDLPSEEIPIDPTVVVAKDNVDEVEVKIGDVEPIVPSPLSLCAMMETFMTTQATHG